MGNRDADDSFEYADEDDSTTLEEGQIYDFITGEPFKESATERTLQVVARSLVDEYGFDLSQLERDHGNHPARRYGI